jgi:hypothetical protein
MDEMETLCFRKRNELKIILLTISGSILGVWPGCTGANPGYLYLVCIHAQKYNKLFKIYSLVVFIKVQ